MPVESKVQLNKEVTNIKYDTKQCDVKVTVTCKDGSKYAADHVIVTVSLGILKARHGTLFTPRLPDNKVKAIQNIGWGNLEKIFLEFETPFWSTDVNEFVAYGFLWTNATVQLAKSTGRAWLIDINSYIRVDGFPNLLECFMAGPRTAEFVGLSDAKVIDDSMWMLETFLGKKLPRPKSMKRSHWMNRKNFLGSYSFVSMAQEANKVSPITLAQSVKNTAGKPIVMFAGEATDYDFSSYAHGAVSSGWRAGNELVTFLKK